MNIKKAMKKIIALGTGMTMVGATIFGAAAAANLSDYPSPLFVKDGAFNGIIVVGDSAAASDVIGAVDIATNLQYESKTTRTISSEGTSGSTIVEGDAVKLAKSSDPLNLGEPVNDPIQTITGDDLNALADGTISNQKGTYKYNQFIDVAAVGEVTYGVDDEQSDDPALYVKFDNDKLVYNYKLSFTTSLESDVDENDEIDDLEDKKITMLGKEYTIIKAEIDSGHVVTLELLGGDIQDTIEEYTSKTYTLNGVDYEVEVIAIGGSPTTAILKVNGEVTEKLAESDTYRLSDGTELGVKTLLDNEGTEQGGGDIVEFYLGSAKVTLTDDIATDTTGDLDVSEDGMDAVVDIKGEDNGDDITLSEIEVSFDALEDYFVPVDGKLSEQLDDDEQGNLFLNNIDYEFAGMAGASTEEFKASATDDEVELTLTTKTGGEFSFTAFYDVDTAGHIYMGEKDGDDFVLNAGDDINKDDYFVLSEGGYSHVMQINKFDAGDNQVEFKDIATGEILTKTVASDCDGSADAELILDGKTYTFQADCSGEVVTFDSYGGDETDGNATIFLKSGAKVVLADDGENGTITFFEEEIEDGNDYDESFEISAIVPSDFDMEISDVSASLSPWDSNSDLSTGYTTYGTYIEYDSNNNGDVVVTYPEDQAEFALYLTSGVTTSSSIGGSEGGEFTSDEVNPIAVGSAKLASEVSSVSSQNMIVIGGPCANSVAAELMGNPEPCNEGFEEGKAFIKLYENGNKVAMLVAGATALDTRRASRVVADYSSYADQLTGDEVMVVGTSTTFSDTVVSAVEEAPAVEEPVVE